MKTLSTDFFTKPMYNATKFYAMRNLIMNERISGLPAGTSDRGGASECDSVARKSVTFAVTPGTVSSATPTARDPKLD